MPLLESLTFNCAIIASDADFESRVGAAKQVISLIQSVRLNLSNGTMPECTRYQAMECLSVVRDLAFEKTIDADNNLSLKYIQDMLDKTSWLTRELYKKDIFGAHISEKVLQKVVVT